jgi:hypothetical protein
MPRWPRSWAQAPYIDSQATNAAEELQKMGGAKVILAEGAADYARRNAAASILRASASW